jgi:hypothetical protein
MTNLDRRTVAAFHVFMVLAKFVDKREIAKKDIQNIF